MAIVLFVFVLSIISTLAFLFLRTTRSKHSKVVGFFHPYTNDGGGGERVLWCAMKAIQELLPDFDCVIYTGDPATSDGLAARALDRFGVRLISAPKVIKLERRKWVEASLYPHFTLLGQSLGSVMLVWEALSKLTPALFFDTSGYAFTYPVAKGFGCIVACYTHYPTISSDMIRRVVGGASMYNNSRLIAKSWLLSSAKALYYRVMASIYGLAGRYSDLTLVNSSWTQAHIEKIWGVPVVRVYPPCDTTSLQEFPLRRIGSECYFVSVAQFRPEKAHELQLEAFAVALEKIKTYRQQSNAQVTSPKLKLIGSCRNDEDVRRLQALRCKAHELGIADLVDFCENVSYEKLVNLLGGAVAGIHSMTDEHFGISIVEYMAAGAIPIAHNSAGPKQDIVVEENGQKTGYLASTVDEFADAMCSVVLMEEDKRMQIAKMARQRSTQFSCERFEKDFKAAIRRYLVLPVLIPS